MTGTLTRFIVKAHLSFLPHHPAPLTNPLNASSGIALAVYTFKYIWDASFEPEVPNLTLPNFGARPLPRIATYPEPQCSATCDKLANARWVYISSPAVANHDILVAVVGLVVIICASIY